jgi:hypothetical protein
VLLLHGGKKNLEEKRCLGAIGVDGKIILKVIFKEQYVREVTRFVLLMVRWRVLVTVWRAYITLGKYLGLLN